jgi:hypothetical protein
MFIRLSNNPITLITHIINKTPLQRERVSCFYRATAQFITAAFVRAAVELRAPSNRFNKPAKK